MTRVVSPLMLFLALLVGVPTPSASAFVEDEMGDSRAGRVYLDAVCPSILAGDRFSRVIWGKRPSISHAETIRRLPEIKRVSMAYGRADQRGSRKLFNPPASWPADVDQLITKLATADANYSFWLMRMGEASSAQEWSRYWIRAKKVRFGTWGTQIRARLGLPPAGEGCS